MQLDGRRILVTGAGRGIGRAVALQAARSGAQVAINSRTPRELESVARELQAQGRKCLVLPGDIGQENVVRGIFSQLLKAWDGLDGLVNAAAIFRSGAIRDLALADFEEVMRINLTGTLLCSREALGCMRPGGAIVNISSLSGVPGVQKFEGFTAYGLSKFGVAGLTEMTALEGAPLGIRTNSVSPGAVNTQMLQQAAPGLEPALEPEDVAEVVCFLLSDQSRACNGSNLTVTGNPQAGKVSKP